MNASTFRNIVFAAAAVALSAGAASAQSGPGCRESDDRRGAECRPTPVPAPTSTLSACYNVRNGNIRLVGGPADCREGERFAQWNVTGPQWPQGPAGPAGANGLTGPQGPQGAQGEAGPMGPAGPSGLHGYEIVRGEEAYGSGYGFQQYAEAKCPEGKQVIGGTWYTSVYQPIVVAGSLVDAANR